MKKQYHFIFTLFYSLLALTISGQVTINVQHKGAYTAWYTISYNVAGQNLKLAEQTINAGGNQSKGIPKGATDISVKLSYSPLAWAKDLGVVNPGRTGGTIVLFGTSVNPSYEWTPDDDMSGLAVEDPTLLNKIYPNGDAELHRVARESNGVQMQSLIDKGTTHVNTKNARGFTPMHECVQKDFGAGIVMLTAAGADMNIANAQGENSFQMAIGLGKKEMAQKMVDQGYPVATDSKAMDIAIKKRNEAMVKFLLENGADANTALNGSLQNNNIPMAEMIMLNYTPQITIDHFKKAVDMRRFDLAKSMLEQPLDPVQVMDYAILKNSPEMVLASLEKGGDPNKALKYAIVQRKPDIAGAAVTASGVNPNIAMEEAIKNNQTDIVTLLLDNNADPDMGLTYAINNNKTNYIGLMIEKGAKVSPQVMATVASKGDSSLLPKLIEAGGDKNAALPAALQARRFGTAEMLIQAGATPDANIIKTAVENRQKNLMIAALDVGADANPGLPFALNNGMKDYTEILLKAGAKTNDPALINAVILKGDPTVLKLLLENQTGPDVGMNVAVANNKTDFVQLMLDYKANANAPGLLETAVKKNNPVMVELLLKNGADATAPGLIATAAKNKNVQIVDLLLKGGADPRNGLSHAIAANDATIAGILINAGADVKNPDLLKNAARSNQVEMASLLINAGADPSDGTEPAVSSNASNVLQLLISKGVNVKDPKYLNTAIKNNNPQMVAMLIAAGNNVHHVDDQGNNYLHVAAAAEADAVIGTLAGAGVKVNELNNAKNAPIHIAVVQGRKEVELVEAFLAAGADADLENGNGKKPLDLAKGTRIKKRLKDAGGGKD